MRRHRYGRRKVQRREVRTGEDDGEFWTCIGGYGEIMKNHGKVVTCNETIDIIDEQKYLVIYNLFDGDISKNYKVFKLAFQVSDNSNNSGTLVTWSVEYEKINNDVEAPYGYMEYLDKSTKEIDAYLLKA
ncbi:MLP-like protein 31 [Arachis ipaensis]|uniref:MLP-like protein 31 n=1 Tax=Arachis ipaensis TaxID=130454 RepID=UPI0007AF20B7|nr:MLP-like protein 31 [Arachis ipaensis]